MVARPILALLLLEGAALALAVAVPAPHGVTSQDGPHEITGIRNLQTAGLTGAGVRIAILDTGLDETHPAFDGITVADRQAFLNPEATTHDTDGHGTLVTGILAAQGTPLADRVRGLHLRGVAPDVELHTHKVFSHELERAQHAIAAAHVRQAVDANVDLICLSLGFGNGPGSPPPGYTPPLTEEIHRAVARGVLVVAAAGNAHDHIQYDDVQYPANLPGVIAVGAVAPDGTAAAFTLRGNQSLNQEPADDGPGRMRLDWKPEVSAPGVGILGPGLNRSYETLDGTSAAVPYVCGGLALLLEAHPWLRNTDDADMVYAVKRQLAETADLGDTAGHDPATGFGVFRADRVVAAFSR